jgi:hypothetical protein
MAMVLYLILQAVYAKGLGARACHHTDKGLWIRRPKWQTDAAENALKVLDTIPTFPGGEKWGRDDVHVLFEDRSTHFILRQH